MLCQHLKLFSHRTHIQAHTHACTGFWLFDFFFLTLGKSDLWASELLSISPLPIILAEMLMPPDSHSIHCSVHCYDALKHCFPLLSIPISSTNLPTIWCSIYKCIIVEDRKEAGIKEENEKLQEKDKEKMRRRWNENFVSIWKWGLGSKSTKWKLIFFDAFLLKQWVAMNWSWWWLTSDH